MGSVGFGELLMVAFVALLAVGPDRLPKMAREVANVIRTVRGVADGVTTQLRREVGLDETAELFRRHGLDEVKPSLTISGSLPPLPPLPTKPPPWQTPDRQPESAAVAADDPSLRTDATKPPASSPSEV